MFEYEDAGSPAGSLRNRVFTKLQNDILNGIYTQGESLIETKLSEELGVSRTPVREALRQLELEGLVQSIPNKGVIVQEITKKDIQDIYTIRMHIEGLAARWAAENITPEELGELKEAVELEEFYTGRDTGRDGDSRLAQFDSRFHDIIFKASKSRPLMQILSNFHHYVQKARSISINSPGRAAAALEEHRAILRAIMERDAAKAERLTTEHIRNASGNLLKQNITGL